MSPAELYRRIVFLINRSRRMREVDEEMRLHADLCGTARHFGNPTSFKEQAWDVWSILSLENLWRDLKSAARVLRSTPGFTLAAVLTLALGIGATTAMFSVIDNVLLEPFPYAQQNRLVSVVIHDSESSEAGGRSLFPPAEFLDYQQQNRIFEDTMGVAISRALWTTGGAPESVNAPLVTGNAFQFLGVPPLFGRFATPSDVKPGAPAVCVMSYSFWQGHFGADRQVIGKTMLLDGVATTVIGVMPPRFVFWSADVWLPRQITHNQPLSAPWFYLLARLKEGLTAKTAEPQIQALAERLAKVYRPNLYPYKFTATLQRFSDASVGKFQRTLLILLAAVGLLLAIACANVANLLLARAAAREREFAIRVSLGAGWWRLARQLFIESLVLASLGATLGCALAWALLKLLTAVLPPDTFPDEAVISLNLRVLSATVAVAIATALFFSLLPMISGIHRHLRAAQNSRRRGQFQKALIVLETAISLVLLAGAGVTMRSFLRERAVPLGLNPQNLLTAEIYLTKNRQTIAQQARFTREFTTALRRAPGILSLATTTDFLPFGGAATEFQVPGKPHYDQWQGQFSMIDPDLFETLNVPLLRGRNLNTADILLKHKVIVVNQAFVAKYFAKEDPIGRRVQVSTLLYLPEPITDAWFQIVGVTADFKNRGLRHPIQPEAFLPYPISALGGFSVIVRTAHDPAALSKLIEQTALTVDGSTVIRHVRTMQEGIESGVYAKPRFGLEIFAFFAMTGLLLANAGLYSILSYAVSQRRREVGIRIALGATPANVQSLIVKSGMASLIAGMAAGLLVSFLLLRFLESQLWGIATYDPITLALVVLILGISGLAACYIPSRSATRVDPAITLRAE